jgi:NDP-sugar pyrophosphorylase family protein
MILAAGEGSRLRPLTLTCPKPMLPVAGRPGLEWIVKWLRHHDIQDLIINLHHRPDAVETHFGTGADYDVHITYSREQVILGTAGGVKRVETLFTGPFVVVYGDVLTDLDLKSLIAFHQEQGTAPHITLSLYHAPNPTECGIVGLDAMNRVTRFVEKPPADAVFSDLANAGVLIVDPGLLTYVPADTFYDFSNDLLPELLKRGIPIYGQALPEGTYLIDIGTPEKYERVQSEWPTERMARALAGEVA